MDGRTELLIVVLTFAMVLLIAKLFWNKVKRKRGDQGSLNPPCGKVLNVTLGPDAKVMFFKGTCINGYRTWSMIRDARGNIQFISKSTGSEK